MIGSVFGQEEIRFNRDIRPILSDNCFFCHGPDEKVREADLRLDSFEEATRDLGGYAAIVPGNPAKSELLLRIEDHDDLMPPPKSKKSLTAEQRALLQSWIIQGGTYEPHWSFIPLEKAALPEVKNGDWVKNPIDTFILSRLEKEKIIPSQEADRNTLIRRLYLDLTGLLPSPEEVQAFVNDQSPDAYEKVVETLLANPHYGERWGRHWLDQARYADSNGYSIDSQREMWPYRDWVINALNEDMPFNQFTIEQLAGDLLPAPTKLQLIATGFHRNTLINQEGGTDPEQFRVEAAIDRVATTGAVWLGLTVGCAQCHTHKFDPITHREFYELYAFFNSTSDRNSPGKTIPVVKGEVFGNPVESGPKAITGKEREALKTQWEEGEAARLRKTLTAADGPVEWKAAHPVSAEMASKLPLAVLAGDSLLVPPGFEANDSILVTAKTGLPMIGAIRLRVLPHPSLPKNGPGTAGNGNFVLTGFEAATGGKDLHFVTVFADHEQNGFPALDAILGDSKKGWAINAGPSGKAMNQPHEAVFVLPEPVAPVNGDVEIRLRHGSNGNYLVGHFAIDFTTSSPKGPVDESSKLLTAFEKPAPERTKEENVLIESRFVAAHPRAALEKAPDPNAGKVLVMEELPAPRETYLLTRGDFTRPDKALGQLHPGGLSHVAPPFPAAGGQNRLDLAKWLVDRRNPLTPRVTMNRVWMRYFGRGLVETEEDFGTQGTLPSHPELLDWLGLTFIENGWSLKAMHRIIVTSATYRQSSLSRPDLTVSDPRNILLARQSRARVDAEIVRDAALCASGLLTPEIGGPGVFPPQPDGVYSFTQNKKKWDTETGPDRYRRAMYTVFFRSAPYPLFTTFDSPDFSSVCTRRVKSNTPLQALNVANDPVFLEFARGLALRVAKEVSGDLEAQVDRVFQLCLSRLPSQEEKRVVVTYIEKQVEAYGKDPSAAGKLSTGELTKEAGSVARGAAMVCLARVVLNTDNFITRE